MKTEHLPNSNPYSSEESIAKIIYYFPEMVELLREAVETLEYASQTYYCVHDLEKLDTARMEDLSSEIVGLLTDICYKIPKALPSGETLHDLHYQWFE